MDVVNLNSFLKLGYFLDYTNPNISLNFNIDKSRYAGSSEQELIEAGRSFWLKAIENNFNSANKNLVPISSGFDSRAILGGLLKFTEARNIYSYTYGTPGAWDYETGKKIAKKTGIKHIPIPLTEYNYTLDELIDVSKRSDHQGILFQHSPLWEVKHQFSEHIHWIGFLGGPLTGSHMPKQVTDNLAEAKKHYLTKFTHIRSYDLTNCEIESYFSYLEIYDIDKSVFPYEEQIDFKNRQLKYIAPHVLLKGFKYALPFTDKGFMDFMLSMQNEFRYKQNVYRKMVLSSFPVLADFPVKKYYGLSPKSSETFLNIKHKHFMLKMKMKRYLHAIQNKKINYLDFENVLREKGKIRDIVYTNIMGLKNRKIVEWVDIDKLWKMHMKRKGDFSDVLLVLASLEIHIKAGKKL